MGATFDDHVAKFDFLTFLDVDLHQLVNCLFITQSIHDSEVNCSTQVHKIRSGGIFNTWLIRDRSALLTIAVTVAAVRFIIIRSFTQNFGFDFLVFLLVFKEVGVKLEDIKPVLNLQLVVQGYLVCNLVVLFH